MNQKAKTLNNLLGLFYELVINLHKNSDFDYPGRPVGASTNWDFLPSDSVLVVYSIDGNNAPSINTLNDIGTTGFVITFSSPVGGNNQIFMNKHVLALRKIGSPAGWSYLGLGSNEKIYMDHNAAQILKNITGGLQYHNFVTDDSDQEIGGQKDFDILPLFNGQPLVYHSEFSRLKKYVRDCLEDTKQTDQDVETNNNDIDTLNANFSSLQSDITDNYVNQGELSNYTPLSQLEYYVTKRDLRNIMGSTDIDGIKDTIHQMNIRCQNLKSELHKIAVQADNTDTDKITALNNDVQKVSDDLNQKLSDIDLGKVKATIHKMNIRYTDLVNHINTDKTNIHTATDSLSNAVNADSSKASLSADSLSRGIASVSSSADSKMSNTDVGSLKSAVSDNASRLNSADNKFFKLNQHNKRTDKRNDDAISSLTDKTKDIADSTSYVSLSNSASTALSNANSKIGSLESKTNHLYTENSQDAQDFYNQAENDESNDVASLSATIKQLQVALSGRR